MGNERGPLVIFIGGQSCEFASRIDLSGFEVLYADTDIRTRDRVVPDSFILVGEDIVKGEGSGSNLNLARACFKKDMEEIASKILGRPLVLIISYMEGATSTAGAVEINSLLMKVGLPSIVLQLGRIGLSEPSERALNLSHLLLGGPLRPGAVIDVSWDGDHDSRRGKTMTPFELEKSIKHILKADGDSASIKVPSIAWNILRESGTPFLLNFRSLDRGSERVIDQGVATPSINILEVDGSTTTHDINEFITGFAGNAEGVNMGIIEGDPPEGKWLLTSIIPSPVSKPPPDDRIPRGPDNMDSILELLGNPDISPRTGL
jgi:hypothetical protein